MWKRRLRRFVVWSSRPPLDGLYRGLYRATIGLALRTLRRHRAVRAIYLSRGCAQDAITPGISDIDFMIIVDGEAADVHRDLARLQRATAGVVDYYPHLVADQATLEHRWRNIPAWRYRYLEGQTTWKLLHGDDVLAALPPLSGAERRAAIVAEMQRWWVTLFQQIVDPRRDAVTVNATCYKVVAELLNLRAALRGAPRARDRAGGLHAGDLPLARKLLTLAGGRFLAHDGAILDESLAFVLRFFAELWTDPLLHASRAVSQRVDCPPDEMAIGEAEARELQALREHPAVRGRATHVVRSACWEFDELLFIVEGDGAPLPTTADVVSLLQHRSVAACWRLGAVVFPLRAAWPRDLHRGLPTPWTAPDIFLQLGEAAHFTDHVAWFFTGWAPTMKWREPSADKRAQLTAIAASIAAGEVVYPLTRQALERRR